MTAEGADAARTGWWASLAALFTSSGTLVCCALPALLVTLGAGSALAGLVAVFPQVVWMSEHKVAVFGLALAATLASGVLQWRQRSAPCPVDPALRGACLRTRRHAARLWLASAALLAVGAWFAFVQPLWSALE